MDGVIGIMLTTFLFIVIAAVYASSGSAPAFLSSREGLARKQLRETREIKQLEQARLEQENARLRAELARLEGGES